MTVKVGSFAKSTAAATASQAITGVGFQPRALIMWTTGATSDATFAASYHMAFGFAARNAADTITVGSRAVAAQDNAGTSNTSQRTAQKALTIVEWGESLLAECDLSSFDEDGFTLSWTTNNAQAYTICYMALGGESFTDAYVKAWTIGTGTGNVAVTGVGFQPDCVLHLTGGTETSLPQTSAGTRFGIGMMTAAAQNVMYIRSNDAASSAFARRHNRSAYPVYGADSTGAVDGYATYVGMDADGFTVNVGNAFAFSFYQISLCLKGGAYAVGYYQAQNSNGDQTLTGAGFTPQGVLQLSVGADAQSDTNCTTHAELVIGAADGTTQYVTHVQDLSGADPTDCANRTTSGSLVETDATPNQSLDGVGAFSAFNGDGFVINWSDSSYPARLSYFLFDGGALPSTGLPFALMQGSGFGFQRGAPGLRGVR